MNFDFPAEAYQRFMGRYSEPLAARFVAQLAPVPGQRALDVGAGPGAVTAQLVAMLGADAVAAIDPSPSFISALRNRLPGIDARQASAEAIPLPDDSVDLAVAQLVVQFMSDPAVGLAEMRRVVAAGGRVAASVWDFDGGRSPLSLFWAAARAIDPRVRDESELAGAREGQLATLFESAGLSAVRSGELTVSVPYRDFDDWWTPYTLGVGPAGSYVASLDAHHARRLRATCAAMLPSGPGVVDATAWTAVGTV